MHHGGFSSAGPDNAACVFVVFTLCLSILFKAISFSTSLQNNLDFCCFVFLVQRTNLNLTALCVVSDYQFLLRFLCNNVFNISMLSKTNNGKTVLIQVGPKHDIT